MIPVNVSYVMRQNDNLRRQLCLLDQQLFESSPSPVILSVTRKANLGTISYMSEISKRSKMSQFSKTSKMSQMGKMSELSKMSKMSNKFIIKPIHVSNVVRQNDNLGRQLCLLDQQLFESSPSSVILSMTRKVHFPLGVPTENFFPGSGQLVCDFYAHHSCKKKLYSFILSQKNLCLLNCYSFCYG